MYRERSILSSKALTASYTQLSKRARFLVCALPSVLPPLLRQNDEGARGRYFRARSSTNSSLESCAICHSTYNNL